MVSVITTNSTTTLNLTDAEDTIISAVATIDAAGDGIEASNTNLTVAGGVFGSSDGIDFNGNAGQLATITQTGVVYGEDDGVDFDSDGGVLTIAGYVEGRDIGIVFRSVDASIEITESGIVRGGSNRFGTDADALSAAVAGLTSAGPWSLINRGSIIGDQNDALGTRIAVVDGAFTNDVPNENSVNSLSLWNSGSIVGDVFFLAGDDTYEGVNDGYVDGVIFLGAGADDLRGSNADDVARGGPDADIMRGGGGEDDLRAGSGEDTLRGNAGDDRLDGDGDADMLFGGKDNDVLNGGSGPDTLTGGKDNDTITGGRGEDTIIGGKGDDVLRGGNGNDIFVFKNTFGSDVIEDFSTNNGEKIDLSGVLSIQSFNDLTNNHTVEVNGDTVIFDDFGNTITVEGILIADLDANDFIF